MDVAAQGVAGVSALAINGRDDVPILIPSGSVLGSRDGLAIFYLAAAHLRGGSGLDGLDYPPASAGALVETHDDHGHHASHEVCRGGLQALESPEIGNSHASEPEVAFFGADRMKHAEATRICGAGRVSNVEEHVAICVARRAHVELEMGSRGAGGEGEAGDARNKRGGDGRENTGLHGLDPFLRLMAECCGGLTLPI